MITLVLVFRHSIENCSSMQISKEQEFNKNADRAEGPEYQITAHGQDQDTTGQTNEGSEGPDDVTEGVVLVFCDEGNSTSHTELTSRETNSSYLSNEFLL